MSVPAVELAFAEADVCDVAYRPEADVAGRPVHGRGVAPGTAGQLERQIHTGAPLVSNGRRLQDHRFVNSILL
jgi:hypothetical protein